MREDELQQKLGGLAERLDEASEPVDIECVLAAPRRKGSRWAGCLLSIAAIVALFATLTLASLAVNSAACRRQPANSVPYRRLVRSRYRNTWAFVRSPWRHNSTISA